MNTQGISALIARVLLALMFLLAGLSKFAGLDGTAGYIASKGLPMAQLLAFGTAALEVGGALLLIVGWKARWAALALAVFTLLLVRHRSGGSATINKDALCKIVRLMSMHYLPAGVAPPSKSPFRGVSYQSK
mgnify:CR=1 FL=1